MPKQQLISLLILISLIMTSVIGATIWTTGTLSAQGGKPGTGGPGNPERDPHPGSYTVPGVANSSYLTIAGYTFVPRPPIPPATPTLLGYISGGGVYITNPPNNDPLVANLFLPNGAIMTEFRFYYYDTSDAYTATAELRRTNFQGTVDFLASVSSTTQANGFGSVATTYILNPMVDNSTYAYTVNVYLNPGTTNPDYMRLYGIRVAYTSSNIYMPVIEK